MCTQGGTAATAKEWGPLDRGTRRNVRDKLDALEDFLPFFALQCNQVVE